MRPPTVVTRVIVGVVATAFVPACGGSTPTAPHVATIAASAPPTEAVRAAVREAYLREFGEAVPQPAISSDPTSMDCHGLGYLMTVAYLPAGGPSRRLLAMYMTRDGKSLVAGSDGRTKYDGGLVTVLPAGRFSVLTVLLTYAATIGPDTLTELDRAQQQVNSDHAAFAASRGYASPIVQFSFTNITVPGAEMPTPRSPSAVRAALEARGTSVLGYDFLVVINIDPALSDGGVSFPTVAAPHFVYMGNFGSWRSALVAANVDSIASAAYHHEVAHHWGWQHDWTPSCSNNKPFYPFITAPVLFGWEDLDGDGIPEILDPTPYGR